MVMSALCFAWTLAAGTPLPPPVDDDGPVAALVRQFEEDQRDFRVRMRRLRGAEREALASQRPHESDYVPAFRAIAEEHRGTEEGCRALLWVVIDAYDQSALEDLIPTYLEFEMLEEMCFFLGHFATAPANAALESMSTKSPHLAVRGAATYVLAANLKRAADLGQEHGVPATIERLYEQVIADYDELDHPEGGTLGAAARRDLYEFRNLSVGRMAPEIDGRDFEGTGIRLSDYRGKVVLLTFWGHWCPPCRDMFEHEKSLVSRLAHRPFALVGVNSDPNLESVVAESDEAGINWRSFWNGPRGTRGPISAQWNVKGWPSLYLLDHDGRIQEKWRGDPGELLEERIEELLRAAEG